MVKAFIIGMLLMLCFACYKLGRTTMFWQLETHLQGGQKVQVGETLVLRSMRVNKRLNSVCDVCHEGDYR